MGRLASTEWMNYDVPSLHEIDRLASDVEYAERMSVFVLNLWFHQVLVFVPNQLLFAYFLAEASCSIINLYQPRIFQLDS